LLTLLTPLQPIHAEQKELPKVVILATGGTIAGAAKSSVDASYDPGIISIDQIIASVPEAAKIASLQGIQVCNIASQNMQFPVWITLHNLIDSLFTEDVCDAVVITHGTDTMEETAWFLNLTLRHKSPVVFTGSMRPSTSLSADGPSNLFNAIALAASADSYGRGVMVVMNEMIWSADDVTKVNTVNVNAFTAPNLGPLGKMRGGKPEFFRESLKRHTYNSEFDINSMNPGRINSCEMGISQIGNRGSSGRCSNDTGSNNMGSNDTGSNGKMSFPSVEIVYCYAFSSPVVIRALIDSGVDGIVIAGVGHGNYSDQIATEINNALKRGIYVVRSSRVLSGGVDEFAEGYNKSVPVAYSNNPQKARILLMLALSSQKVCTGRKSSTTDTGKKSPITEDSESVRELQRIFRDY